MSLERNRISCLLLLAAAIVGPLEAQSDTLSAGIRLWLNIPAMRLDLFRGDTLERSYAVAVGTPDHPTPEGRYTIRTVEWNPWWVPPAREWTAGAEPTPPGPTNPMGRVKLFFRPFYFLHGTPDSLSIGRAASHGCVRLGNADAVALAVRILEAGVPEIEPARLSAFATDRSTTSALPLQRTVPLEIVYRTVEVDGDSVRLHPNPYGRSVGEEADALATLLGGAADSALIRRHLEARRTDSETVPLSHFRPRR